MPESRDSIEDIWGERTPFRGQANGRNGLTSGSMTNPSSGSNLLVSFALTVAASISALNRDGSSEFEAVQQTR